MISHISDDMLAHDLADQLKLELGFTVDLVPIRYSGARSAKMNFYRRK